MFSVCCYGTLVTPMLRSLLGVRLATTHSACQAMTASTNAVHLAEVIWSDCQPCTILFANKDAELQAQCR
jgi:hypothetical protein